MAELASVAGVLRITLGVVGASGNSVSVAITVDSSKPLLPSCMVAVLVTGFLTNVAVYVFSLSESEARRVGVTICVGFAAAAAAVDAVAAAVGDVAAVGDTAHSACGSVCMAVVVSVLLLLRMQLQLLLLLGLPLLQLALHLRLRLSCGL